MRKRKFGLKKRTIPLFWINDINSEISIHKVNIIKKQNTVLIYIANDIKKHQPWVVLFILQPIPILTTIKTYCSTFTFSQLSFTLIHFCIELWIKLRFPYVIFYCVIIKRLRRKLNTWNTQQMCIRYPQKRKENKEGKR